MEGGAAAAHIADEERLDHIDYENSLGGMQKIAFITDLTDICNWFFSFCALTWGTSVVLGDSTEKLGMWDFCTVSFLLFMEGICFGVAALLRLLGYRLSDFSRWALRYVAFFIPLVMGVFALLSIITVHVYANSKVQNYVKLICTLARCSSSPNLCQSIYMFYVLILINTAIFLLGNSITGLMRRRYVNPRVKSLCKYYDNMIYKTTSWLRPAVDLEFAFKIQGSQYRRMQGSQYNNGINAAHFVCENYADLIWYLYMHEKGLEAAEAALAAEDGYVREAAAYIVGFWAVLETLEEGKYSKLPLCFQRGMLSKLANIAAESYGSLGTAAAWSFALLLESVDLEMIGKVACVRSSNGEKDLIEILVQRAVELILPPCPQTSNLPQILEKYSHAHIYALRQYIQRLQGAKRESGDAGAIRASGSEITTTTNFNVASNLEAQQASLEAQQAQLLEKVRVALPPTILKNIGIVDDKTLSSLSTREKGIILQSLDHHLSKLLPSTKTACYNNYQQIKRGLTVKPPPQTGPSKSSALLFHIVAPLICVGVGSLLYVGMAIFVIHTSSPSAAGLAKSLSQPSSTALTKP